MFDSYNMPNEIDVNIHGNVLMRDQKHEWRDHHCPLCKDGIITEKEFDMGKALQYLETHNIECPPSCCSMMAFAQTAKLHVMRNKDNIDFTQVKSYPCVHKYCEKIND